MSKKKLKAEVELSIKDTDECMCDECDVVCIMADRVAGYFVNEVAGKLTYFETIKLMEILLALKHHGFMELAVETLKSIFAVSGCTMAEKEFELFDVCQANNPLAPDVFMELFFENEDIDDICLDILIKNSYMKKASETAEKLSIC